MKRILPIRPKTKGLGPNVYRKLHGKKNIVWHQNNIERKTDTNVQALNYNTLLTMTIQRTYKHQGSAATGRHTTEIPAGASPAGLGLALQAGCTLCRAAPKTGPLPTTVRTRLRGRTTTRSLAVDTGPILKIKEASDRKCFK